MDSGSSGVQLRRLCRHILGPDVGEEVLSANFRSALQLLSTSTTGQEDQRANEFVIAEKIKKNLVRDGRERDTVNFTELHLKLQKSSIVKNREAILSLLLNLSERSNRTRKIPPFSTVSVSSVNGTVESGGVTVGRTDPKSYLASVIPGPYRNRPTNLTNGNYDPAPNERIITPSLLASPDYRPPLPPKPKNIVSPSQHYRPPVSGRAKPDVVDGGAAKWILKEPETEASERELIRELLYAFQGVEGSILIKDDTGGFQVHRSKVDVYSPSLVQMALRLAEMGWLYNSIHKFIDSASGTRRKDLGLVGQSLVTALREELADYYRLLSLLEDQLKTKRDESDTSQSEMAMTLHKLSVYAMEPMAKLKLLATIVRDCADKKLKGGSLISAVYGYLHHGNRVLAGTVRKLLTSMSKPIFSTLIRWIRDGTLEDPHAEFFIASDPQVTDEARMWHDKYSVRKSMIPKFLSLSWVKKILATGKSINFLRCVCGDPSPAISGKDKVDRAFGEQCSPADLFADSNDNKLMEAVHVCYAETSALVLDTLFKKYKLVDHFSAMRKYLLLGQGDLIRYLMELLDDELSMPATSLYPHSLAGLLETAIRATNAQFEDPDILDRLDVRLLDVQPGDSGWDVFSLDYKVAGPISAVFGTRTMTRYLMLFNSLWRAKRMEWILARVWTRQTSLHKIALPAVPEMGPVLHMANLLSSEMIHFVHQMAYYTAFEVMECSWDELMQRLRSADNLDEVIDAHDDFLSSVVRRALLGELSRDLLTQLRAIYDRVVELEAVQSRLYASAMAEADSRRGYEANTATRAKRGLYGVTQADEDVEGARRLEFETVAIPALDTQLKIVAQSYQDMVRTFLLQLAVSQDQSLQCLSFRLDFNAHYRNRDATLGTSMTFQHKRLSIRDEC